MSFNNKTRLILFLGITIAFLGVYSFLTGELRTNPIGGRNIFFKISEDYFGKEGSNYLRISLGVYLVFYALLKSKTKE